MKIDTTDLVKQLAFDPNNSEIEEIYETLVITLIQEYYTSRGEDPPTDIRIDVTHPD